MRSNSIPGSLIELLARNEIVNATFKFGDNKMTLPIVGHRDGEICFMVNEVPIFRELHAPSCNCGSANVAQLTPESNEKLVDMEMNARLRTSMKAVIMKKDFLSKLPKLEIGDFFMAVGEDPDEDPFIIGVVLKVEEGDSVLDSHYGLKYITFLNFLTHEEEAGTLQVYVKVSEHHIFDSAYRKEMSEVLHNKQREAEELGDVILKDRYALERPYEYLEAFKSAIYNK